MWPGGYPVGIGSGTTGGGGGGGDLYELCPDALLTELNGAAEPARVTALLKQYRAQKR